MALLARLIGSTSRSRSSQLKPLPPEARFICSCWRMIGEHLLHFAVLAVSQASGISTGAPQLTQGIVLPIRLAQHLHPETSAQHHGSSIDKHPPKRQEALFHMAVFIAVLIDVVEGIVSAVEASHLAVVVEHIASIHNHPTLITHQLHHCSMAGR